MELIDYKTGRPRSQKDADKSLQLSVYALATSRELQIKPISPQSSSTKPTAGNFALASFQVRAT